MGLFDDIDGIFESGRQRIDDMIDKESKKMADALLKKYLADEDLSMEDIVSVSQNIRGIDTKTLFEHKATLERLAKEAQESEDKRKRNLERIGDIIGVAIRKGLSGGIG